ncbi:MAG: hypothetical protein V4484_07030 [Pseudomonadota bacterium]
MFKPEILRITEAWRVPVETPAAPNAVPARADPAARAALWTFNDYAVFISLIIIRITLFFGPLLFLCVQSGLRGGWVLTGTAIVSVVLTLLSMRWVKIGR